MKKQLVFIFLFPFFAFAQTYPFNEGFEGLVSSQPPPGWGGTMKVLLDHGVSDTKGLSARLSSAVLVDSSITPLIGPLTSASCFSFKYRIVDYAFYPNTETYLDSNDKVEILISTDAVNYQLIYLIDMDNHTESANFSIRKKVFVTQYAGSTVNFKIRCTFDQGASYYVDFDTIAISNDPSIGIEEIDNKDDISIFPNPCSSIANIEFLINNFKEAELKVFNSLGEKVMDAKLTSNFQLPTSNLPNDIYYVQVADETRRINRKLIVHH